MTVRKSPLQVGDQSVENVPFVFIDAHEASRSLHLSGLVPGFSYSDRTVVFVDPPVNLTTAP